MYFRYSLILLFLFIRALPATAQDFSGSWSGDFSPTNLAFAYGFNAYIIQNSNNLTGTIRFDWPEDKHIVFYILGKIDLRDSTIEIETKKIHESPDSNNLSGEEIKKFSQTTFSGKIKAGTGSYRMSGSWKTKEGTIEIPASYGDLYLSKRGIFELSRKESTLEMLYDYLVSTIKLLRKQGKFEDDENYASRILAFKIPETEDSLITVFYTRLIPENKPVLVYDRTQKKIEVRIDGCSSIFIDMAPADAACFDANFKNSAVQKTMSFHWDKSNPSIRPVITSLCFKGICNKKEEEYIYGGCNKKK